ncbi:MAG: winged helix DNA-binding domain-containing protein [Tannerellaceae bacterium]|jgi:hypothetical protein|nr:winged helix DNA-binding domain-containing protein [Tannerellaceae bacterium]
MNTLIANLRLHSQQLVLPQYHTAKDIAEWMGAMQAQDCNMAKWAVGIRLRNCHLKDVESALDKGAILRTHVLRPTWHFVSSENIRWMLALSAKHIITAIRSRDRELGITEDVYSKTNDIIIKSLEGGRNLTREALSEIIERHGLVVNYARISHFLMRAEAEGIICSGIMQDNSHTYALLDERVPARQALSKEEALATLATTYFSSHGPATFADYVWWSGLSISDARKGLEDSRHKLYELKSNGNTYWMSEQFARNVSVEQAVMHLLPAYDEYIISYKDRSPVLSSAMHAKVIASNGVFRPVIIVNGITGGIWKRSASSEKTVSIDFFDYFADITQGRMLHDAIDAYKVFIERKTPS